MKICPSRRHRVIPLFCWANPIASHPYERALDSLLPPNAGKDDEDDTSDGDSCDGDDPRPKDRATKRSEATKPAKKRGRTKQRRARKGRPALQAKTRPNREGPSHH